MPEVKLVIDGEEVVLAPKSGAGHVSTDLVPKYIKEVLLWNSRQ